MNGEPYFAGKKLPYRLNPVVLNRKRIEKIQTELGSLLKEVEEFTSRVVKDPSRLVSLGLPRDLDPMPTPLGLHIPFARFDVVLDADSYWIYELNTDGTSGYNLCEWLGEKAGIPESRNPNVQLSEILLKSLLEHQPEAHGVHLVDFSDVETRWEQEDLVARWQKLGADAHLSSPNMRTWAQGSLIYRRALSWQLRARQEQGLPFLEDWKQKKITVVGGWSSDVGMSKAWPVFIKHSAIPQTEFINKEWADANRDAREEWVIKGALSYSGRSVFKGRDLSQPQWESALFAACRETENKRPWVAQLVKEPEPYEGENLELGFFFINGKPRGIMSRWGSQTVISDSSTEELRPVELTD